MACEAIVKKAIKGDDEAFYSIIHDNKEQLYRIAFSYLKNKEDSLEAIQEMTFRAYKNISKLKKPKYFKTWIIRILINYCVDEQKRQRKTLTLNRSSEGITDSDRVEKLTVESAVDKLKPKYKDVIVLKYFEDLTISEIADIMKCPEGTIKTRLSRGLASLRKYLGEDGEF
ncbi:sigma-70 family RNA polymerase sigma factor [Sporosalibacterium faouarense]|uniref:sigma-70 family RNA polymerase sigma factor n=1 Tax=Sporosalibacterium faouarense TaxID=516123 RepID=UPI00141C1295|nr:sigma-70 family RNA polymerase sigma factor [Sporosalibacterium faouarense]MTI47508.1 sigma-70 family RNA polymerase sigma factor [Bacillota bacterium]